jgi:Nucleotidyltransferase domain
MDLRRSVPELLEKDPRVRSVRLGGSRAAGRAHAFSDWDFVVETDHFLRLAKALPALVAPLRPLAQQWDPYSSYPCYMLMLAGPTKVDLIFAGETREWSPAWRASTETLAAIDSHFWDWVMWLEQKRRGGDEEALTSGLRNLYDFLLRPMGADASPSSVPGAVQVYLERRGELERRFAIRVSRELENAVRPAVVRRAPRRA